MIMETMKFKIGDRVRVKSLEWYNSQEKNASGDIDIFPCFTKEMVEYCGKILNICTINYCWCYLVSENEYQWDDWMLEDEPVTEEKQEQLLK